tara:strand:- start:82 stop:774 length:693 start_codon:yes stop_codon:yes gene_type:complete
MENNLQNWNNSYENKDNFLFVPNEEVVRFISKYIQKRVGINNFKIIDNKKDKKILDFGCGIGRHIIYGLEMGLDMYGFDLSDVAIKECLNWIKEKKLVASNDKILSANANNLPWDDNFFQYGISHAVLDSMTFDNARLGCKELNRVLEKDSLFYCDLISGDDSNHNSNFSGEEIIKTDHEYNTIQNYYNYEKICLLIKDFFSIEDIVLVKKKDIQTDKYFSRFYLVLRAI